MENVLLSGIALALITGTYVVFLLVFGFWGFVALMVGLFLYCLSQI